MSLKLLLSLLAIVVLSNAVPVTQPKEEVSAANNFFTYLKMIRPPDAMLFKPRTDKNAIKTATIGKCAKTWLENCQKDFATALGRTVEIFNDPDQFEELVGSYHTLQFSDGILKLCAAQVKFRNCLTVFYPVCTDPLQILKDQITDDIGQAFQLGGIYDDIEFECGGGLAQAMVNWKCIVKVTNKADFSTNIGKCADAYKTAIGKNQDAYCSAGQVFSLCFAEVYANLDDCAKNKTEVQWWACERANRRFKLDGFCEQNTCASLFPKKQPQESATMEDVVNFANAGGLLNKAQKEFFHQVALFYQKNPNHPRHKQD